MKPKAYALILVVVSLGIGPGFADELSAVPGVPWPATDGLGRSLPLADEVGPPRPDRFVGIFYFLWHNAPAGKSPHWDGPYDISRILRREPDALSNPDSPLWGRVGQYHYWGEPLYGYYRSDDPWVLRRHAQMLADAGVDTLIFDTTNAQTYPDMYLALCRVFQQIRDEGGRTPQISFMVNTKAGETADRVYRDLYQKGLYRDLWFHWLGKPLMICDPAQAGPELQKFFTLRRAHWPFTMVNTEKAWHWEAAYPQPYGYADDPAKPEQVNVSVAQNLRASDGKVTNMSEGDARGRSFHNGAVDESPAAVNFGHNFQEQWHRVFELNPPFAMITGWNEWIAGRWERPGHPIVFVDQYDQEHSRDIEFAKVGHHDNYYWQMVANIRRYKGVPSVPVSSTSKTIDIQSSFDQWEQVAPEFRDHVSETIPRDHAGVAGLHYSNRSGRNDLIACKATHDTANVYFYLRTAAPIRPSPTPDGLWLLIDSDRNHATGWEGYDLLVGRQAETDGRLSIEKHVEGWGWEKLASAEFRLAGNQMHVAIPWSAVGQSSVANFDFKWVDNCQDPGNILDFYLSGDVAPEGRFDYRYAPGPGNE
ncbi:MAG: hypothetical protein GXX96_29370 [Planctomycetaceae bacterium]|nr:hypothetical protein [Planctomycetaceae bacterium]